ncbi:MAG: DUF4105 domain-containing protein, partial [Rubricoccaceae bacterium]|nr:DUF4105 domain-containing protein [Rubricoccaceae bacterium]
FLRGNLNYILDTAPYDHELEKYHFLRRPMIAQRLNLPTETIRVLYANLEINAHPENRAYRYDFLFDNCSTRILDQLNRALSESELDSLEYSQSTATATFREHLQPYISDTPWLRLGVNLGLGLPADEVATTEQESFLPILLMRILDSASTASGPLVARKDTVVVIPEYEQPSNAFDLPQILLWLVLIVGCVITVVSFRTGTPGTSTRVLDTLLFAVVGFVGLVLTLLWFATQHEVTGPNLNVLWAWPTHLFVAWWLRAKKAPRWLILYLSATAATCGLVLIGWLFWPQPLPTPLLPLVILLVIRATARLK